MKFDNNEQRRAFWQAMIDTYTADEVEAALNALPPDTSQVLQLHYLLKYSLPEICRKINRSITVVRNHHNRGIFKMHQYFERRKK